jgi:hypothetical protein
VLQEFRGFVCQQKFNALSQYFHFCYWPELVQHKDEIARRVTEYWETRVKHRVKHTSYTIDFAVLQDQIYVIEINPFVRILEQHVMLIRRSLVPAALQYGSGIVPLDHWLGWTQDTRARTIWNARTRTTRSVGQRALYGTNDLKLGFNTIALTLFQVPYYEKLLDKLLREEDSESEKEKSRRCIIS